MFFDWHLQIQSLQDSQVDEWHQQSYGKLVLQLVVLMLEPSMHKEFIMRSPKE